VIGESAAYAVREWDAAGWDDYIAQFASAGPFHSRAWAECFTSDRLTPVYLGLLAGDRPVGGITGVRVEPARPLMRGIDRTLSCFSGPALREMSGTKIREAMTSLAHYARSHGLTSLVCAGRDYPYAYDWGAARVHLQVMHEYFVDLSPPWEAIAARMRKSIAEQARKAARSGLSFEERRDSAMLPMLLQLVDVTRNRRLRKDGIRYSPYYLPHLGEVPLRRLSASGIARFFAAKRDDTVLCTLLAFAFGKRAYALLIGCSEEGYRLRAPAFMWWHSLQRLKAEGAELLNLAGGGPASPLGFAKQSLGATRRECTGCVSPYLKGPLRNVLFQTGRWLQGLARKVE
jgi:hypothetical protein